jgi:hypothetical protein
MAMTRRSLLQALATPLLLRAAPHELRCDVAIFGGGVGGVAAAMAALRNGMRVVLTDETDWIGGQMTAQAVPPDEHPWIEKFGRTRSYAEYRNAVREYYRAHFPLTNAARSALFLNPGGGTVSALAHEPRVSLAVLESMLAPHASSGRLVVLLRHKPLGADVEGDRVRSVSVRALDAGIDRVIEAGCFLDATEQGDLLPLTRTEFVTGAESQKKTGEPHAPERANPADIQAFTFCFAVDYLTGENHVIDKPEEYGFWRDYVPNVLPPWPGRLLSWVITDPVSLKSRPAAFDPTGDRAGAFNLWVYRRIAQAANFTEGSYASDISLINWPQNDYWLGNLYGVPQEETVKNLKRAKQLSLSLLYWMQTEAPRPDGSAGWPGLRLRYDVVGTEDGLAKYPYIRESRRIEAEYTVLEQHVGAEARRQSTGKPDEELTAENFSDSVGVGSYRIDLHPSSSGQNYIDISSLPFQIPLGALIPKRVDNLLAACKNIGTTHITNGCYRLHPVEEHWRSGRRAGCSRRCFEADAPAHTQQSRAAARFSNVVDGAGSRDYLAAHRAALS